MSYLLLSNSFGGKKDNPMSKLSGNVCWHPKRGGGSIPMLTLSGTEGDWKSAHGWDRVEGSSFVAVHLTTGKVRKQHALPSNNNSVFYSGNKASEGKKSVRATVRSRLQSRVGYVEIPLFNLLLEFSKVGEIPQQAANEVSQSKKKRPARSYSGQHKSYIKRKRF